MAGTEGMRKAAPMRSEQDRQRMWNSMRILRQFSTIDIQLTADVRARNARQYVRVLLDAGYLRIAQPAQPGAAGGGAVYALVRNTGPHAPRAGLSGLRDPNLEPAELPPHAQPVQVPRHEYQRALACVRACAGMTDPEAEVAQLRALAMGASHD